MMAWASCSSRSSFALSVARAPTSSCDFSSRALRAPLSRDNLSMSPAATRSRSSASLASASSARRRFTLSPAVSMAAISFALMFPIACRECDSWTFSSATVAKERVKRPTSTSSCRVRASALAARSSADATVDSSLRHLSESKTRPASSCSRASLDLNVLRRRRRCGDVSSSSNSSFRRSDSRISDSSDCSEATVSASSSRSAATASFSSRSSWSTSSRFLSSSTSRAAPASHCVATSRPGNFIVRSCMLTRRPGWRSRPKLLTDWDGSSATARVAEVTLPWNGLGGEPIDAFASMLVESPSPRLRCEASRASQRDCSKRVMASACSCNLRRSLSRCRCISSI
mmetsp:Transcript_54741/g.168658  ORF Transcript_54741/g.168658 Transcript_54741/m.168658 type:complete len:343 (-) Transcript_54741:497-1525(-)